MTQEEIKYLLHRYNLTPNKLRGQNFLLDEDILEGIAASAHITRDDLILEIGPGLGALTQKLAKRAGQIVAFELDHNFQEPLNKIININQNIEVIWQDILSLQVRQWQDILAKYNKKTYKVVANIPYYLTGKLIQKFMLFQPTPQSLTLLVQKEVAERIVAQDKKMSLLSLAVQLYGQAKILQVVEKENFYPAPKVDSALVQIFDTKKWSHQSNEKKTWQLIKRGFSQKRKKLINNLLSDQNIDKKQLLAAFQELNLSDNIRAENLQPWDWVKLSGILFKQ